MIELSRYITFGQYINNKSVLARLDPRVKLVGIVLLIILISWLNSFIAFAFCLLFCTLLHRASRISLSYLLGSFRPFLPFLAFAFIVEVLFYTAPKNTVQLWQWWIFAISWNGIITSTLTIIRVLFLYYLISLLTFTTSLTELTNGMEVLTSPLERIGIPVNDFVMILVIAFKFVPIFIAELERLMKAQVARGMRFDQGNLFQRVQKLATLLVPLFVSGFKRVKLLSTAMEARCYGGRPGWRRSKRKTLYFKRPDVLALLFLLVVGVVAIAINLSAPF